MSIKSNNKKIGSDNLLEMINSLKAQLSVLEKRFATKSVQRKALINETDSERDARLKVLHAIEALREERNELNNAKRPTTAQVKRLASLESRLFTLRRKYHNALAARKAS